MLDEDEVDDDELVEDEELVEEEDDTFPLDELVLDTFPELDVLDTFPELDVLETLPELEVLDTPPVLDEVEVEPPLEVEEMTMLPLDPVLPPPKNPPAKKPPPKPPNPPLPPMITGGLPPPPEMTGAGGSGIGAPWLVTVTVAGAQAVWVFVTTFLRTGAWWTVRRTTCLAAGRSATWTAPPPMIAPPQAQAHSFAKAIRTDMTSLPRCWRSIARSLLVDETSRLCPQGRNKELSSSAFTNTSGRKRRFSGHPRQNSWLTCQGGTVRRDRPGFLRVDGSRVRSCLWRACRMAIGPLGLDDERGGQTPLRDPAGRDVWLRC